MPRPDLLALTDDDLAALANRGLVKRAQREAAAPDLSATWKEEPDGTVSATWSDGAACVLPGGATVREARCTCGALELCRHVLRTVLAWQARQAATAALDAATNAPAASWDPGSIGDALVEAQATKAARDRAAALWSQGVLAELLRSAKPSARFHCPGHTVRFPVPGDLRYALCSCPDPAPCAHAVLAVRTFRLLAPELDAGIVSAGPLDAPVRPEALSAAEACVRDLLADGLASAGPVWRDRALRAAGDCAASGLAWPAQILEELAEDWRRYDARDAAFHPAPTVHRIGELLLRLDAIRAGRTPVPQAFVRGLKSDRDADLGAARFVGLGASVTEHRRSSVLTVFLQDGDNGHMVTVSRDFTEDPDAPAARKSFAQLGRAPALKDATLAGLAAGQLITQGGRRTAAGRLVIGRARAAVNPQGFAWEQLKAPVLVEDFGEVRARLRLLPPASLRPRRAGADFHVCPVEAVESAAFDPRANAVVASLRDRAGQAALLVHPWTERGQAGAEALLAALAEDAKPLFVAGHLRAGGSALIVHPTALVLAGDRGSRRVLLPWLEATAPAAGGAGGIGAPAPAAFAADHGLYRSAAERAAQVVLEGLRRSRPRESAAWTQAVAETDALGAHRMAGVLAEVGAPGEGSDPADAALRMFKLLALARDAST